MSTIELVDPELREALALAPQLPLTARYRGYNAAPMRWS